MSKEKFLAIIDTELYFKDNEFWSKIDESTRKKPCSIPGDINAGKWKDSIL